MFLEHSYMVSKNGFCVCWVCTKMQYIYTLMEIHVRTVIVMNVQYIATENYCDWKIFQSTNATDPTRTGSRGVLEGAPSVETDCANVPVHICVCPVWRAHKKFLFTTCFCIVEQCSESQSYLLISWTANQRCLRQLKSTVKSVKSQKFTMTIQKAFKKF